MIGALVGFLGGPWLPVALLAAVGAVSLLAHREGT